MPESSQSGTTAKKKTNVGKTASSTKNAGKKTASRGSAAKKTAVKEPADAKKRADPPEAAGEISDASWLDDWEDFDLEALGFALPAEESAAPEPDYDEIVYNEDAYRELEENRVVYEDLVYDEFDPDAYQALRDDVESADDETKIDPVSETPAYGAEADAAQAAPESGSEAGSTAAASPVKTEDGIKDGPRAPAGAEEEPEGDAASEKPAGAKPEEADEEEPEEDEAEPQYGGEEGVYAEYDAGEDDEYDDAYGAEEDDEYDDYDEYVDYGYDEYDDVGFDAELARRRRRPLIIACCVLLVLLVGLAAFLLLHGYGSAAPEDIPQDSRELSIDAGARAWAGVQAAGLDGAGGQSENIRIPNYPSITVPADTRDVYAALLNPEGNPCYFTFQLLLKDTGEVLYTSGLVPPGSVVTEITLARPLSAGEYDAVIRVTANDLEDGGAMNDTDVETVLIAQ